MADYSKSTQRKTAGWNYSPHEADTSQDIQYASPLTELVQNHRQSYNQQGNYIPSSDISRFLNSTSEAQAAELWLGEAYQHTTGLQWLKILSRDIARIERLLESQVNEILHHPVFQQLESAWRSLDYLVSSKDFSLSSDPGKIDDSDVQIQVLNISKKEMLDSFRRQMNFDESELFQLIYEQRFGLAGASPFGLLIGNYSFTEHHEDVFILNAMSGVAAAAFAPFIAAAGPELLGMEDFSTMDQNFDIYEMQNSPRFLKWKSLRKNVDTRFIGLTLPRVLIRKPYVDDGTQPHGFRFNEDVTGNLDETGLANDTSRYLWGNPAFSFAAVVIRAFISTGWFADIRGEKHGTYGGGLVTGLPALSFKTESINTSFRPVTEMIFNDYWERELCEQGFIPLIDCQDSPYAVFRSNQSVYQSPNYLADDNNFAQENERLSGMLQYILCASRFAHFLKAMAREKIGSWASPEEIQDDLNSKWLQNYVSSAEILDPERRAEYPLRYAQVNVTRREGFSGVYDVSLDLQPQYQLDNIDVHVKLDGRIEK